jgi:site-specific recombinase XerD
MYPTAQELPIFLQDFLTYIETIQGKSPKTVSEYTYDLRLFFRYLARKKGLFDIKKPLEEVKITELDSAFLSSITLSDLYSFMNYINTQRNDKSVTRSRKVAAIKSFFKYAQSKAGLIKTNPASELESPKIAKTLPRYLDLDESIKLLDSISGKNKLRDYCIITLFLNCGMRLSELVGINLSNIKDDTLTVIGKGNKERTIYLNDACLDALKKYEEVRPIIENEQEALFLSERKRRISPKTVQYTVKKYIETAGLDKKKYSTHKLRHTAATLMYSYGDVDIKVLQEILGHESVATTEIYTHVNNKRLKEAVKKNPLGKKKLED